MSEGQPALTPEQEAEVRQHLVEGCPLATSVLALEAALAREREARVEAERERDDEIENRWKHEDAQSRAEGRVRKLQEALERVAQPPGVAGGGDGTELLVRIKIAREALVGLPEDKQ